MTDQQLTHRWLQAMTKQGEDRIWRGAEIALRYLTEVEFERDRTRSALVFLATAVGDEADGEFGLSWPTAEALMDARCALEGEDGPAIATEAGTAETENTGSVHEGPVAKPCTQPEEPPQ